MRRPPGPEEQRSADEGTFAQYLKRQSVWLTKGPRVPLAQLIVRRLLVLRTDTEYGMRCEVLPGHFPKRVTSGIFLELFTHRNLFANLNPNFPVNSVGRSTR